MSERPKLRLIYFIIPILICGVLGFGLAAFALLRFLPSSLPSTATPNATAPSALTGTLPAAIATSEETEPPAATEAPASCGYPVPYQIYVVQPGDTLARIARATNLTVDELVEYNCLMDADSRISAGQQLYLPADVQIATPNPTQSLDMAFDEVNRQFKQVQRANIAYNIPETMKRGETVTIELLLNPSSSQAKLATQLVERSNFLTSTAEAGKLVTKSGGAIQVVTSAVEITDRMKAVLKSQTPGAFDIVELHDSPEQPISPIDTTKWRWSVTAAEEGEHTLELVLNRLVKYEGKEYWVEVQSYHAEIKVKVTPVQWLESLDWKWFAGILLTALLIPLFFRWVDSRNKKVEEPAKPRSSSKKPRKK